jgi:hypothetical protein
MLLNAAFLAEKLQVKKMPLSSCADKKTINFTHMYYILPSEMKNDNRFFIKQFSKDIVRFYGKQFLRHFWHTSCYLFKKILAYLLIYCL